jgi:hypothetical protein
LKDRRKCGRKREEKRRMCVSEINTQEKERNLTRQRKREKERKKGSREGEG